LFYPALQVMTAKIKSEVGIGMQFLQAPKSLFGLFSRKVLREA
jgi:hypothetical protein